MSPPSINASQEFIAHNEVAYGRNWIQDSVQYLRQGLYQKIADLIDPQDGELTLDVGTGMAFQLGCLKAKNPNTRCIGTERMHANVFMAERALESHVQRDAFEIVATSEHATTSDGRVYWKQDLQMIREKKQEILALAEEKPIIIDDNILYPESLPLLLGDTKIDAAILSLAGGSSARSVEWPYKQERISNEEVHRRMVEITERARQAFFHFASEYVRPEGRIILADRATYDASMMPLEHAALLIGGRKMENYGKYWDVTEHSVFMPMTFDATRVGLRTANTEGTFTNPTDEDAQHFTSGIFIAQFQRKNVAFNEQSLERPK